MLKLSKRSQYVFGLTIVLLLIALMHFTGMLDIFSLQNLKSHRAVLVQFVANHYFLAVLSYLVLTTLIIATTLPLAAFVMILAGLLFGIVWGVIFANIGATLGACISFVWLRYAFRQATPGYLKSKLENFSKNIDQYGSLYFLSLHLMSLLPFFIINALAVVAHISFFTFFWTTSLGILPVSILYAYIGQRLGEINTINEVLTWPVMLTFFALALVALLPVVISKFSKNKN